MRKLFFVLLLSSEVWAQGPAWQTLGLNNGYFWEAGEPADRVLYLTGIADGIRVQAELHAIARKEEPDQSLSPKGVSCSDAVKEMDFFYAERLNVKIPIMLAYAYVVKKFNGASADDLSVLLGRLRTAANQP